MKNKIGIKLNDLSVNNTKRNNKLLCKYISYAYNKSNKNNGNKKTSHIRKGQKKRQQIR